ncbi:MAG: ribosome maturation factor RimP [Betaproteobacteria bacterium]
MTGETEDSVETSRGLRTGDDAPEASGLALGELLERTVPALGYELVDWDMAARSRLMRVFIDKADGVSVEDCARVSNHLTRLFVVEAIEFERLEVSSPGLDRPVKRLADYARFAGHEAQLTLAAPVEGAKRIKGILRGIDGDDVLVETAAGVKSFPFGTIARTRLVPAIDWRKGT